MHRLKYWSLLVGAMLVCGSGQAAPPILVTARPLSCVRQAWADGLNSGRATYTVVNPATVHVGWTSAGIVPTSTPVAALGRVYVARLNGTVFSALDAVTGAVLWDFGAPGESFEYGAVCSVNGGMATLYIASSQKVYCLKDGGTGAVPVWSALIPSPAGSDLTFSSGRLYLTTKLGMLALVCLDAATGAPVYMVAMPPMQGIKPGVDPMLGYAYVGKKFPNVGLACVNAQGQVVWQNAGEDPYGMPIVVDAGMHRIYANVLITSGPTPGRRVRCYDGQTGAVIWDSLATASLATTFETLALAGGKLLAWGTQPGPVNQGLWALDAATGNPIWTTPAGPGALLVSRDRKVWLKDFAASSLSAFDLVTGQFLGSAAWTPGLSFSGFGSDEAAFYANEGTTLVKFLP